MDKKIFTTRVKTNLNGVLQMTQTINGIMMTGDNAANQIIVEVYDDFDKVNLVKSSSTKIVGYFIRSDGYTVEVDGTVDEEGNAKVIIPEVAYQISGSLSIAIRYFEGPHEYIDDRGISHITWDSKIVIASLSCYIQMTESNSIIDPSHHIKDVQELLEYIDILNEMRDDIAEEEQKRVIAEGEREQAQAQRNAAIDNMEVQAVKLEPSDDPTASIAEDPEDHHKIITFGLVQGPKGDPGTSGTIVSYDNTTSSLLLTLN